MMTATSTKRILKVTVTREVDTDPDTSHLGEYGNSATSDYSIDRAGADGYFDPRTYRFFNPTVENYLGESKKNIRKYVQQDYERMESLNNGQWGFIGIHAQAAVQLAGDVVQTLRSGGLWGIESDSDEGYLGEVQAEQLAELRTVLQAVGFSLAEIIAAFKAAEQVER
jgi:hypothetical protein